MDSEGEIGGRAGVDVPFLDVIFCGPHEPVDQEIAKTLLGVLKFVARIHSAQNIVVRHLVMAGGGKT